MRYNKAQALIAAILIIVMLSLFATMIASIFGTQVSNTASGLAESTQAFYLAHGGLEWYMQQLAEDSDWSDETAPVVQTLGSGTFEITLFNEAQDSIDIVSTSMVVGPDGADRERFVSATLERTSTGPEYAVFWGDDSGNLTFANGSGGTDITGDMWSAGSSSIGSNSSVSGTVYYPSGETISGSGSYSAAELTPSPSIPSFDDSSWETLMTAWNTRISNAGASVSTTSRSEGSGTFNLSADTDFGSLPQPVSYRTINTNGYNIIRGTGSSFTVNCRNFNLQTDSEIESDVPSFDINCTREFTMTSSQMNSDGYTIDCRDFVMDGASLVNSQSNTINSNRDIVMNDTSQISSSNIINTRDDFSMNDTSQITADSITINCRDIFTMNDSSQITGDSWAINVNDDFRMTDSALINSDDFEINTFDTFDTNGTVSITGFGYVVCSNAGSDGNSNGILLHHANGDSGTFIATPSGGTIYFLSGENMTVNSNAADTTVTLNAGCVLYSSNPSGNDERMIIRNDNTSIDDADIIAERRITIQNSADITDSFIFLDRASGDANNYLRITGAGTTVSGTVVSMGRAQTSGNGGAALRINSDAAVTGLAYQYDGVGDRGKAQINGSSTITGAFYVYRMYSNSLGPATITYDSDSFPSDWPDGFSFVRGIQVQSGTWDGL